MKQTLSKCEKQELQILTENGFKNLSDVKVGEVVFDSNGNKTTIKSKNTSLKDASYILINGGIAILLDRNHLLEVSRTFKEHSCRVRKYGKCTEQRINTYAIRNYIGTLRDMDLSKKFKHKFISCSDKFKGNNKKLPLDPYYLGLLLGDGSFFGSPIFTVNTKYFGDIANRIKKLIKNCKDRYTVYKDDIKRGNTVSIRIAGQHTTKILRDLNLYNHNCYTKWVPIEYLMSTKENRLEMLRGLMDTDGTFIVADTSKKKDGSKMKRCAEFDSTSKQLAKDVGFLCLSLGGSIDSLYKKPCSYRLNGKKHKLNTFSYRYNIRMPKDISIFKSKIKKHKEKQSKLKRFKMFNFNKQLNDIIDINKKQKITKITLSNGSKSFIGNSFIKMYV